MFFFKMAIREKKEGCFVIDKTPETIDEIDLARHMDDNASRVEMVSLLQKRFSYMQRFLLKAQALSDKDFETAFSTFESAIEVLNHKKQKNEVPDKNLKGGLSNLMTSAR